MRPTYITIIEPRGVYVVHFTNFIRHFKRPGFWKAKFKTSLTNNYHNGVA